MEKFGVENIKKAIGAVINIGENVEQARDDGEVSLGEAISITVGAIPPIKTWVQEEFDLEDDFVESKIEAAFDVVVSIEKYFSIKRVA